MIMKIVIAVDVLGTIHHGVLEKRKLDAVVAVHDWILVVVVVVVLVVDVENVGTNPRLFHDEAFCIFFS